MKHNPTGSQPYCLEPQIGWNKLLLGNSSLNNYFDDKSILMNLYCRDPEYHSIAPPGNVQICPNEPQSETGKREQSFPATVELNQAHAHFLSRCSDLEIELHTNLICSRTVPRTVFVFTTFSQVGL